MSEENSEISVQGRPPIFLDSYKDSNEYAENVLRAVLDATKASNAMPASGEDYEFFSSFSSFRQVMLAEGKDILNLISSLTAQQVGRGRYEGLDLEEKFDLLTDVNDMILERVGNNLDEADGIKKKQSDVVLTTVSTSRPIHTSWNKKTNKDNESAAKYHLLAAKNVLRPQLTFKTKVDNSNTPFVPIIADKPNSIKPLAILLEKDGSEEFYSHPYECEIEHFQPTPEQLEVHQKIPPPLDETPYMFVSTVEDLQKMCKDLMKQKEIAVDVEHHSYRTFQGITCLVQISTRQTDYIVDTLALRHELHVLNEIFTHPKIIKVFHGADMDVQWLQRDFGIYLVGLFDTGQAARVLNFSHFSLAFLLRHYCGIEPDKQFQLADWRIRPLPREMVRYAREDTHYLLYIYDRLRKDLLDAGNAQKNLLLSVFQRSKQVCLKRYEKPLFDEDRYLDLCKKSKKSFNSKQQYALKHLYSWRDRMARLEDESTGYVLPNHMLLQISEILPRDHQGIIACCNPCPPLVRQNLNELHTIIRKARELTGARQKSEQASEPVFEVLQNEVDLDSILHRVHDAPRHHDPTLSLPTLLDDDAMMAHEDTSCREAVGLSLKKAPILSVLTHAPLLSSTQKPVSQQKQQVPAGRPVFVLPYQRYKTALANAKLAENEKAETAKADDSSHAERVHKHIESLVNSRPATEQSIDKEAEGAASENPGKTTATDKETDKERPKMSYEERELTEPLRQQSPSKTRRGRRAAKRKSQPEVPSKDEAHGESNAARNQKPEDDAEAVGPGSGDAGFHPFDYQGAAVDAQATESQTTGKKKKKWTFNPQQQGGPDMKGGRKRTKKQVKSHTYSNKSCKGHGTSTSWPKR
ncbi:exosome complex component 10-like isoform X2 [Ornithodoros turicata]|uniref:exosome complex component 10-like isoform X2 n=1 Tax=Ornithodoros turicata TaxID=34597 RepID=UPI003139F7BE